jgi:tRNA dimethylallyltransferase
LYVRALIDGLFEGTYKDESLRNILKQLSEKEGTAALHAELSQVDPDSAERIHPNDAKRIIRALEVFQLTGKPMSAVQKTETLTPDFPCSFWGLDWPRKILYERIESRVDKMIQDGLVEEVQHLEEMGYHPDLNSLDTLGYREVFQYLSGVISLEEMVALIKQNTRRFAKRQLTWFRADARIRWIPLDGVVEWGKIASEILNAERKEMSSR